MQLLTDEYLRPRRGSGHPLHLSGNLRIQRHGSTPRIRLCHFIPLVDLGALRLLLGCAWNHSNTYTPRRRRCQGSGSGSRLAGWGVWGSDTARGSPDSRTWLTRAAVPVDLLSTAAPGRLRAGPSSATTRRISCSPAWSISALVSEQLRLRHAKVHHRALYRPGASAGRGRLCTSFRTDAAAVSSAPLGCRHPRRLWPLGRW